jgi:ketosteroid isomerase-like protein
VERFLLAFVENVAIEVFEPRRFMEADGEVLVHLHLAYTVKRTGKRVDEEQIQWWTVEGGQVTRLRHFEDTAQVIAAWAK